MSNPDFPPITGYEIVIRLYFHLLAFLIFNTNAVMSVMISDLDKEFLTQW